MTFRRELLLLGAAPDVALEAVRWTEFACSCAGLDTRSSRALAAAVIEAVNNSLEHGYALAPGDVRLTLDARHGQVEITVTDHGRGLPPAPGATVPGAGDERGRGSWIMRQVCDEVRHEFNAGQQSVVLVKRLSGANHVSQGVQR
ncbi:MAG: ATP-binding protein [Steroidobacteraceae bacterium]